MTYISQSKTHEKKDFSFWEFHYQINIMQITKLKIMPI